MLKTRIKQNQRQKNFHYFYNVIKNKESKKQQVFLNWRAKGGGFLFS